MKYNTLGKTDTKVSEICLGTMTWGQQNTEIESYSQMDMALDYGVNFFDTAELYPVPPKGDTYTETESIIGRWFSKTGKRDKVILASKVAGPGEFVKHIRGGPRFTREHISQALEDSLQRLKTDYIDLYQLHWPDRNTNYFGQRGYRHDPQEDATDIEETLGVLDDLLKEGKIRHIGLSNETPWGVSQFLKYAEKNNWTRVVSIQNPYSLLNRTFEVGLAEMAHREAIGLLAYSPLGFGVLSGKYLDNQWPEGARITLFKRFDRYINEQAVAATQAYVDLAKAHNLDPAQLALQFVTKRSFMTSNIIGATSLEQLKSNLESINIELTDDIKKGIRDIHTRYPNPSP